MINQISTIDDVLSLKHTKTLRIDTMNLLIDKTDELINLKKTKTMKYINTFHDKFSMKKQKSKFYKRRKYLMFNSEFKKICIDLTKEFEIRFVSKTLQVPLKSLKRWMNIGADRLKGGGRKTRDPEMEKKLLSWLHEMRFIREEKVTSSMIRKKALEFTINSDFRASKGWLEKFKLKYSSLFSKSKSTEKNN